MSNAPAGQPAGAPAEAVDAVDADPGGVPFDDEIEGEIPPEEVDRGGAAYDSASYLTKNGIGYPTAAPIGMAELRRYVTARWGGTDLGILARPPRPVRGGTAASLHNWGMAWDWRWSSPGPGRPVADEVIKFCLDHAQVLGIQAVHDYQSCRYWKSYAGWKQATSNPSTGFGQPWAQWLHIERMWADANRGDKIDALVGAAAGTPAGAPAAAAAGSGDGYALPTGPLKIGSVGADVGRLQDFLRFFKFADFTRSDGTFGQRTDAAVRKAQQALAAKGLYSSGVDGIWGPKSAGAATQFVASFH